MSVCPSVCLCARMYFKLIRNPMPINITSLAILPSVPFWHSKWQHTLPSPPPSYQRGEHVWPAHSGYAYSGLATGQLVYLY